MNYNNYMSDIWIDNGVCLVPMTISKRVFKFLDSQTKEQRWAEEQKRREKRANPKPLTREERIELLHKMTTYDLNRLRRSCYRCSGYYSDYWEYDSRGGYNLDEVLEVMNTREHIPNKKEGKRLRREAAKRKV